MLLLTRTNAARTALLLGAGLSFVTPIWAQNAAFDAAATNAATAPLQAALSAENTPLTLPASALDASWRRFKTSKSLDSDFKTKPEANENSELYSYLTRGETLKVGDETFLVAYRTRTFEAVSATVFENFNDADVAINSAIADQYMPENYDGSTTTIDGYLLLVPTQTLRLCLFNTRAIDGLGDIRAFNAQTDLIQIATADDKARAREQAIAERAQLTGNAVNQRVDSDLKQIGLAMLMYIQDYDEKLPPMRSSQSMADIKKYENREWDSPKLATVQQVLTPYLKLQHLFAHPTTREIYRPNINISGRSLASLEESTGQIVTFYEPSPASDGRRAVLYLDGHVKRELENDWPRIRAASDAVAPPFKTGKRMTNGNPTSASVTLHDAAAMAYMLRRQRDNQGRPQQVYLSKSTGRIYYRDAQTKQAIWLSSPTGTTAPDGITIPYRQAQEFREFQGYNGQSFGRTFGDEIFDAEITTAQIKTALGANSALSGSKINVDTMSDGKVVILRGTTASSAQKTLAEAIAKKNAHSFRIVNQLIVTR